MNKYLEFAQQAAAKAGRLILKEYDGAETATRDGSIQTKFDLAADKFLISQIKKRFPKHSLLTEETGWINPGSRYLWIIDPIDGTGNFVNHNPLFCVSVALWIDGQPAIGVIEAPFLGERYVAVKGKGAWKINAKAKKKSLARVSSVKKMSEAYLIFCFGHKVAKYKTTRMIDNFYAKVKRMRQLGAAGIELGWVGLGRADAFVLPGARLWDIAAGVLFVLEAGGRVMDLKLKPWDFKEMMSLEQIDLVAANAKLQLPKKINY